MGMLFFAEIIGLVASILASFSTFWICIVLILVGDVVGVLALVKAKPDAKGYQTALYVTVAIIVLDIISAFVPSETVLFTVLSSILSIIISVLHLVVLYYVCITTADLLNASGETSVAARGVTVWKINLICTIVSVVIALLMFVPLANLIAVLLAVVLLIVALVGYIMYLTFLYSSSRKL